MVQIYDEAFRRSASPHLQAALRDGQLLNNHFIGQGKFNGRRLAFRAINKNTYDFGGCITGLGLFSRTNNNQDVPVWRREHIVYHLAGERNLNIPAPYISISTSPKRINNLIAKRPWANEIVILDMDMMDSMDVTYIDTMQLKKAHRIQDTEGGTYCLDTHFMVYNHIPQGCILGYISGKAFIDICSEKRVTTWESPPENNSTIRLLASSETIFGQQNDIILDWHTDFQNSIHLRQRSEFAKPPQFSLSQLPVTSISNDKVSRNGTPRTTSSCTGSPLSGYARNIRKEQVDATSDETFHYSPRKRLFSEMLRSEHSS